jgi:uncharacterized membrane protein YidH (DUF202 family)
MLTQSSGNCTIEKGVLNVGRLTGAGFFSIIGLAIVMLGIVLTADNHSMIDIGVTNRDSVIAVLVGLLLFSVTVTYLVNRDDED